MCLTTFVLLALFPIADAPATDPSVAEIEQAILKRRRSIQRGIVSFETKISRSNSDLDVDRFTTIWFNYDKNKIRSDVVNHWKNRDEPIFRHIQCYNCERPNYYVDYEIRPLKNGSVAMTLAPISDESKKQLDQIIDPRMLGLVALPSGMLRHHHFETVLNSTNRDKPKLRRDRWKGLDCWVISFHNQRGTYFEYWVVPSHGYNVTRNIVKSRPASKVTRITTVETEAAPVGSSGLWFPRTCTCETVRNGKLIEKEVLRITKISLNEPIDNKVFTLAGMDIAPGTTIAGKQPNGQPHAWTWTGTSIVDHVNPTFLPEQPPPSRRGWLIATAVACAIVAMAALVFYFRRGRLKPSAG